VDTHKAGLGREHLFILVAPVRLWRRVQGPSSGVAGAVIAREALAPV